MIQGTVNASREAKIQITLLAANGETTQLAIIDTGFTGFLTLPSAVIKDLKFEWLCREDAILGDGRVRPLDVFEGEILWSQGRISLEIIESETSPLIGMSLLADHEVRIQVRQGGRVTLDPL